MILGIPLIWYWLPIVLGFAMSAACAFGRALEYVFLTRRIEVPEMAGDKDE